MENLKELTFLELNKKVWTTNHRNGCLHRNYYRLPHQIEHTGILYNKTVVYRAAIL